MSSTGACEPWPRTCPRTASRRRTSITRSTRVCFSTTVISPMTETAALRRTLWPGSHHTCHDDDTCKTPCRRRQDGELSMSFGIEQSKRGYTHAQARFVNSNLCWSWFVRLLPAAALVAATACSPHAENVTVDKLPTPVASLLVSLLTGSITVGQTTRASAVAKDSSGNTLANRPVTWASSNPAVATITDSGVATGLSVGTSRISATSEDQTGSVILVVSAAPPAPVATVAVALGASSVLVGQSTQATVTLKDSTGATLTGRTVTWVSSNTAVATVSSSGLVNGMAAGSAQITATSEGQSGSATVTVSVVPVATVTVALAASSVSVGQSTQATATLKDANGNTLTGRSVSWASNNTAVATVSSSGLVSAIAAGSAQITATSEGQSGSVTLTVTVAPVATVTVALGASSVSPGQSTQATATLKDANGNTLTGRTVTWVSNNTAVATVSGSGLVNAIAVGSAQF